MQRRRVQVLNQLKSRQGFPHKTSSELVATALGTLDKATLTLGDNRRVDFRSRW